MDGDDDPNEDQLASDEVLKVITFENQENGVSQISDDDDEENGEMDTETNGDSSTNDESPPEDLSICSFRKHSADVFTVDFGPSTLAASGGEDDRAFLWDLESGETILECVGHTDSITWVRQGRSQEAKRRGFLGCGLVMATVYFDVCSYLAT